MKALTLYPEIAECAAIGRKTIETRSWRTHHRGRLLIHAGKSDPDSAAARRDPIRRAALDAITHGRPLPLGAIVGSAAITDCLPIVEPRTVGSYADLPEGVFVREVYSKPGRIVIVEHSNHTGEVLDDVTDQLPLGDFTPGRWAWVLDDAKPTTERCPACWGGWEPPAKTGPGGCSLPRCPTCDGASVCDPIPAKGRQGLWEWTP